MNENVKEVVSTLLAGRAYVFSAFHRLLGSEPTKELLDAVASEESLEAVSLFEGENDGLLTPKNAEWTNFRGIYTGTTQRGISHPDETDYRRFRFTKQEPVGEREISDMAQFYLCIAEDLKRRGF